MLDSRFRGNDGLDCFGVRATGSKHVTYFTDLSLDFPFAISIACLLLHFDYTPSLRPFSTNFISSNH
jgi:hypothetical protein